MPIKPSDSKPKRYDPNTRITLDRLTDSHLKKVIGIYRELGLEWTNEMPEAWEVQEELATYIDYELRPTMVDVSKFYITKKPHGPKEYLHFYFALNPTCIKHDNSIYQKFDEKIRKEFGAENQK